MGEPTSRPLNWLSTAFIPRRRGGAASPIEAVEEAVISAGKGKEIMGGLGRCVKWEEGQMPIGEDEAKIL
jgi:hypothetical protein